MAYSEAEILELSKRIGSGTTLWRWASQGCDLRSHASVQTWIEKNRLRETNVTKSKRRRDHESDKYLSVPVRRRAVTLAAMGDLPPIGKKGAAAALERLEASEERAHARLEAALVRGDPIQIQACQEFWLRCSETLRRLDLAVEVARRQEETKVPLRVAEDTITAATEWMRISFAVFLSSEGLALMGIRDYIGSS
jgi:hypothetical protein